MDIPFEYYDNNVQGTLSLTQAMYDHHVRNIIFSSTCAVYSPSSPAPYDEMMPTGPESVYAMSKLMIEQALLGLHKAYGLNVGILRYFNPIGNHPSGRIGEIPQ
jgi:UDP-glucose 4-epimerase